MILRRVTLVPIEAVSGILGVQFEHHAVPRDLGDNRCRGNGRAPRIAVNDRPLRHQQVGDAKRVNEHEIRQR